MDGFGRLCMSLSILLSHHYKYNNHTNLGKLLIMEILSKYVYEVRWCDIDMKNSLLLGHVCLLSIFLTIEKWNTHQIFFLFGSDLLPIIQREDMDLIYGAFRPKHSPSTPQLRNFDKAILTRWKKRFFYQKNSLHFFLSK